MILYEDNAIIVCHKPAGIPVQSAGIITKDMVSILNNYLAEKRVDDKKTGKMIERVQVVHRLDQPVEGVLVFAKTKQAASDLSRQIADGRMKKVYYAVCCVDKRTEITDRLWIKDRSGKVLKAYDGEITLVDYLAKDSRTNMAFVSDKNRKDARRAELSFRILGQSENGKFLFAEIDLKTGRFHQIRVQMAHAGIPLFGDRKYNEKWEGFAEDFKETYGNVTENTSLGLCAVSLSFMHPVTGKKMNFKVKPEGEVFRVFMHRAVIMKL